MNIKTLSTGDVAFVVFVKPGQKKDKLELNENGDIILRVAAPPVDGKANVRVIEFFARVLEKAKRDILVNRGELSRHKEIRVKNANAEDIAKLLKDFLKTNRGS